MRGEFFNTINNNFSSIIYDSKYVENKPRKNLRIIVHRDQMYSVTD